MTTPWLEQIVADSHARLLALPETHPARQLLLGRGVEDLTTHRLGWLATPHAITSCTPAFWAWVQRYGWDQIVFPLTDPFGHVTGVQLRSPREKGYRDFLAVPTEVCPPTFGTHVALPAAFTSRRLVVVEGVFDYFAVAHVAVEALAILTSTASAGVRRLLARYASLVVCLTDMDAPGRRGAYKLAGLPIPPELRRPKDVTLRAPVLPPYQVAFPPYSEHDPGDLWTRGKHEELRRVARAGLV